MNEERCCGNCCWFCFEDAYGEGQCYGEDDSAAVMCDEPACDLYVSRQEMRHHMAVLLLIKRWYAAPGGALCRVPSEDDMIKALDFAYRYMKVFNKL